MTIPAEFIGKAQPIVGLNLLSIQLGETTYVFSSKSAKWISPGDRIAPAKNITNAAEERDQSTSVETLERHAAIVAQQIRTIMQTAGEGDADQVRRLADLRESLKVSLANALDLKLQLESLQVEQLESRMTRLKGMMDQRKTLRDQIIDRRLHELLDTDATKWESEWIKRDVGSRSLPMAADKTDRPQTRREKKITVDLYAGEKIYGTKTLVNVVTPLNQLPDVVTNIRVVGGSDQFIMAHVFDPS